MTLDDKDARIKELEDCCAKSAESCLLIAGDFNRKDARITTLEAALDDSTKERCRVVDINNALTAQVGELREALYQLLDAPNSGPKSVQARDRAIEVHAKTASDYAGKCVIDRAELDALRRVATTPSQGNSK